MERLRVLGIMMMWAIMWYNRGKMYLSGEQGTKMIIKFHFPLKIQSGQNPSFLCQLWPNCFQHFGEGEKKGWVDLCFKLGGFLQPISQLFWTDPTVYIYKICIFHFKHEGMLVLKNIIDYALKSGLAYSWVFRKRAAILKCFRDTWAAPY